MGTPLAINASGQAVIADISNEATILGMIGFAGQNTPSAANGSVVSGGRLENLTGYAFSAGDPVYIGPAGTLINVKPDISTPGFAIDDFVVFCGIIVKNEYNPSNIDLQIYKEIVGQLG